MYHAIVRRVVDAGLTVGTGNTGESAAERAFAFPGVTASGNDAGEREQRNPAQVMDDFHPAASL